LEGVQEPAEEALPPRSSSSLTGGPTEDRHQADPGESSSIETLFFDRGLLFLNRLDEVHQMMIEGGLGLWVVNVTDVEIIEDHAEVQIADASLLWVPGNAQSGLEQASPSQVVAGIPSFVADRIKPLLPLEAVAVFSEAGEAIAMGFIQSDRTNFVTFEASDSASLIAQEAVWLGDAATWLFDNRFDPVPRTDPCQPESTSIRAESPMDSVVAYFHDLAGMSRSARLKEVESLNSTVEELLSNAPTFVDPVTGDYVSPAANDIAIQLREGTLADDVVLRPAIPVGIIVPDEPDPGAIVVLLGQTTDRFLGALELQPTQEYDDQGQLIGDIFHFVLYIVPPLSGENVDLYMRSVDNPRFMCSAPPDELPVLSLNYNDVAGSNRVEVDLESGIVSLVGR
jgi:hypothetical protein